MQAGQIMTRKVISVAPETSIFEAAALMLRNHVSGLPVVNEAGVVVGIVSEGDFLRRSEIGTPRKRGRLLAFFLGYGGSADDYVHEHGRKVSEVMTPSPRTVSEDTPLPELVSLMETNNIKRVPVVRGGKLVGIGRGPTCYGPLRALSAMRLIPRPKAHHRRNREERLVPNRPKRHRS